MEMEEQGGSGKRKKGERRVRFDEVESEVGEEEGVEEVVDVEADTDVEEEGEGTRNREEEEGADSGEERGEPEKRSLAEEQGEERFSDNVFLRGLLEAPAGAVRQGGEPSPAIMRPWLPGYEPRKSYFYLNSRNSLIQIPRSHC
jgi:hypothetical protein